MTQRDRVEIIRFECCAGMGCRSASPVAFAWTFPARRESRTRSAAYPANPREREPITEIAIAALARPQTDKVLWPMSGVDTAPQNTLFGMAKPAPNDAPT